MAKENMFGSIGVAVEERTQEQQVIEATIKGQKVKKRGPEATTMTVSIGMEEKQMIKMYAVRHRMSVSDVVTQLILAYCKDDG